MSWCVLTAVLCDTHTHTHARNTYSLPSLLPIKDTSIVVKFLPELMTLMVDTTLQQVSQRLKETVPTPRMPPDAFRSQLGKQAAMLIASAYALLLAEQKDFPSVAHLLPIIASVFSSEDVQLPDGFLHHIGCLLCASAEVLREDLGELILKDFYLACCCSDEGLLYTCRFLWLVGDKVPRALLDEVLKEMGSRSQVCRQHERGDMWCVHWTGID